MEKPKVKNKGYENLIPITDSKRAKELGSKGGRKSAEIAKKKKTMQQLAKAMLEQTLMSPKAKKNVQELFPELESNEIDYRAGMITALVNKVMSKGDHKCFTALLEATGDKQNNTIIAPTETKVVSATKKEIKDIVSKMNEL